MILYINTNDKTRVSVAIKKGKTVVDSLFADNKFGSQVILPLIDQILQKNNLNLKELIGIEVDNKDGSYTGLRVGVSVANALGYSLGIPVNGKEIETEISY